MLMDFGWILLLTFFEKWTPNLLLPFVAWSPVKYSNWRIKLPNILIVLWLHSNFRFWESNNCLTCLLLLSRNDYIRFYKWSFLWVHVHELFAYFSKKGKELCISYFKVYGLLAGLRIKEEEEKKKNEENFGLIIFVTKWPWCLLFVFFGFLVKYNPSEWIYVFPKETSRVQIPPPPTIEL